MRINRGGKTFVSLGAEDTHGNAAVILSQHDEYFYWHMIRFFVTKRNLGVTPQVTRDRGDNEDKSSYRGAQQRKVSVVTGGFRLIQK